MPSSPKYSGLLTDLYELTMAAGYLETGFDARATFELFVRSLPPRRNYLAAAGLDQALDFLENVRFSDEEIAYARKLPVFAHTSGDFFNYLAQFHFSGDVWAMPEGTIFFPGEPILRFLDICAEHAVLLVDTYDVRAAVEKIISAGRKPQGVRLDSGDLAGDSAWARARLDQAGWKDVIVFASGDLDEDRIFSLLAEGARIDSFGVGTALVTSNDSPTLGVIYKLVEIEIGGEVRSAAKFSAAKVTYPGRKQDYRFSHTV